MKRTPLVSLAAAAALVAVTVWIGNRTPPALPEAHGTADIVAEPASPEPAASVAPSIAEPVVTPPIDAPEFDVVRVEPDGSAVVAGTAAPGAKVTVYADDAPLAHATADADGNFVAIFRAEPTSGPRALTLGADDSGNETVSADVVMLLPAPPAAPTPDRAPAAEPAPVSGAAPPESGAPEVAATAIIRGGAVEVTPVTPAADGRVTLASISYAEAGDVTLAGGGTGGASVRVYVDGSLTREVRVGPDGRWSMELTDVAAGLYTLRIDQVTPDGRVASRVETPFQRDYPRAPAPRPGLPAAPIPTGGVITVQPGTNLWTLARTHYGSGVLYTQIFTANRDLIRDPDLIYPGQILAIPDGVPGP